jgi:hypothetical protein
MKSFFFSLLFIISSLAIFPQENELPSFLAELSTGYAVGIGLDNAFNFDIKFMYPYKRFGFAIEAGGLFTSSGPAFHTLLGPMILIVNTPKWRVPLIFGGDMILRDTTYFGVGGILSVHRRLSNIIYFGASFEVTYAFANLYDELTGYKTNVTKFDDGTSKTQTVPVFENKSHFENNFYLKPSLLMGLQF